jgi:hypothetical protein
LPKWQTKGQSHPLHWCRVKQSRPDGEWVGWDEGRRVQSVRGKRRAKTGLLGWGRVPLLPTVASCVPVLAHLCLK